MSIRCCPPHSRQVATWIWRVSSGWWICLSVTGRLADAYAAMVLAELDARVAPRAARASRRRRGGAPPSSRPPRRPRSSRAGRRRTRTRRAQADALGAELEDLRLRLVQPDLAGDHDAVEELGEASSGRSARGPIEFEIRPVLQARPRGRGAAPSNIDSSGSHAGEQAVDQARRAVRRDAEQRPERRPRTRPRRARRPPAARSSASASGSSRNSRLTVSRSSPSASQKARKRVEDVGGEDAAEVDQQARSRCRGGGISLTPMRPRPAPARPRRTASGTGRRWCRRAKRL